MAPKRALSWRFSDGARQRALVEGALLRWCRAPRALPSCSFSARHAGWPEPERSIARWSDASELTCSHLAATAEGTPNLGNQIRG